MLANQNFGANLSCNTKWAFTTRRVNRADAARLSLKFSNAKPGDLVLARVEHINSHKRIQLDSGRPSQLYPGDLAVLACGARYAPDQYEGIAELDPRGADLLAGGGLIGRMRKSNKCMTGPTRLIPLGLICGANGSPLNLSNYALPPMARPKSITVIAAVGASMNAGKTTAVSSLAHGLGRAGYRVATLKITGTGAFGDYNAYLDAGAVYVADFVDVGMGSTYREPLSRISRGMDTLLGHAAKASCDVAVIELADGIFQHETAALLGESHIRAAFDGVMLQHRVQRLLLADAIFCGDMASNQPLSLAR